MKRHDIMKKSERGALGRKLAALLRCDIEQIADITRGAIVKTKAGELRIHFDLRMFGTIFCRFQDPQAACKVLHGTEKSYPGRGQRLNPYSGKWNFHFGDVKAEHAFSEFESEFNKVRIRADQNHGGRLPPATPSTSTSKNISRNAEASAACATATTGAARPR